MAQYDKAISYFEKALNVFREEYQENNRTIGFFYQNIGGIYALKGERNRALEYYQIGLDILQDILGDHHPDLASILNNIGVIYKGQEDYARARSYYWRSIEIRTNAFGEMHPDLPETYRNIGLTYAHEGVYDLALEIYMKGLMIAQHSLGAKHPIVADCYSAIARAHKASGDINSALENVKLAKLALNYSYDNPFTFDNVGDMIKLQKLFSFEYRILKSGLDNENIQVSLDSISSIIDIMMYLEKEIQNQLSANSPLEYYVSSTYQIYEQALDHLIFLNDTSSLYNSFSIVEAMKCRELKEEMVLDKVMTYLELPDSLSKRRTVLVDSIAIVKQILYEKSVEKTASRDSNYIQLRSKLFALNRDLEAHLDYLRKNHESFYKARYGDDNLTIEEIRQSLIGNSVALVEYMVGDSSIFTFTVLPDTFYVHQIKKDFPLDAWVEDMLHGIYDPYTPKADTLEREYSFEQAASLIYNKVFLHVDTLLPEGTDIILVPDGILGYIPIDALLTDSTDSESYLIRDHQISYAYSATLQAEMENMQHDHKAQKKILAFAPSFDHAEATGDTNVLASRFIDVSNARNWLGPLKYNDDEVRSISQMVPADLFMDSTATKEQFLKHASDYSIIHLSTHGKANDKMGDYSFLAFYDPQDSSETWLYNRELYGLDLNADMVVLSACETGIGELQRGEGIISLARGFSYAGAKSIITTLWSVNDRSTQKVMELFYGNLAEGMPKDAALRQAKLAYLDEYPHLGKSPYFWAGIIPIGDMSPISFQAIWYQNPWNWLGALLIFGLLFWAPRKIF
jgi:CHAT domain-containing protein/Tfp pilus assembly protein PilF